MRQVARTLDKEQRNYRICAFILGAIFGPFGVFYASVIVGFLALVVSGIVFYQFSWDGILWAWAACPFASLLTAIINDDY